MKRKKKNYTAKIRKNIINEEETNLKMKKKNIMLKFILYFDFNYMNR